MVRRPVIQEEMSRALANRDRQQLGRLRADADRIRAELALVERQLERSELRAPFAGIVLKGDPGQSLGSPVEQGEVLFEVASSGKYRLSVEVDEHDVGLVETRANSTRTDGSHAGPVVECKAGRGAASGRCRAGW